MQLSYSVFSKLISLQLNDYHILARRRLMRDFRRLQSDPPQGVTAAPEDEGWIIQYL